MWAAVRAQCNCRYRLFEVVRKAAMAVKDFPFKKKKTKNKKPSRLLKDWVLESKASPAGRSEGRVNKVCQCALSLFSALLNSCCTLHDATCAHGRQTDTYIHISREWGTGIDLRRTLNRDAALNSRSSQPLSGCVTFIGLQRKPAGPATTQTCSVRLSELSGRPLVVRGRKGRDTQKDTEGAVGIVIMIPTFCWKSLIQFIIFPNMIYWLLTNFTSVRV